MLIDESILSDFFLEPTLTMGFQKKSNRGVVAGHYEAFVGGRGHRMSGL